MSRARLAGIVATLGLAAGVVVAAAQKIADFDLGWHLALGRLVATTHALPMHDDLSFTFRGQRAPDEFLADTLLYLAARAGGGLGLQLLGGVAIALLVWLMIARARPVAPWPVAVAFAALGLMAAGPWLVVRPALLSFVCFAASALVIDEHRHSGRGLWRLVPLQLLWSNLHGFAVFGPLFALAYAGDALLFRRAGAGRTAAIAAAVAAIACCSPLGWRLYIDPFIVVYHQPLITEWTRTSLGFVLRYDLPLAVLGLALVAALVRERPAAYDVLVGLVAVALSLMAVRMIALGAILAAPLCARRLGPALARARGASVLVALLGLLAAPVIASTPDTRFGRGYDRVNLPEGAVRFLVGAPPGGRRMELPALRRLAGLAPVPRCARAHRRPHRSAVLGRLPGALLRGRARRARLRRVRGAVRPAVGDRTRPPGRVLQRADRARSALDHGLPRRLRGRVRAQRRAEPRPRRRRLPHAAPPDPAAPGRGRTRPFARAAP